MMRIAAASALSMLCALACGDDGSSHGNTARALTEQERRAAVLDSLAPSFPCTTLSFRVMYDSARWTPRHACAVAGWATALLAASRAAEPHYAPSDTSRIRSVSVRRIQPCEIDLASARPLPGRIAPMVYAVEIDVPQRSRFITVSLDPFTLRGEIGYVHKGFDGSDTLLMAAEPPDSATTSAPCGDVL